MNGLRVLSIFWIIIGHRVYNNFIRGNNVDYREFMKSPQSSIIIAYNLAVDTFLVLGASLMTWSTMRDIQKGDLSIARMIWRRYLRYTPAFAALILFVVSLKKFFINGPYPVTFMNAIRDPCIKNWWAALLHIQNFFEGSQMCIQHTWYLSADFQLFIISPFLLFLVHKFGKRFLQFQ